MTNPSDLTPESVGWQPGPPPTGGHWWDRTPDEPDEAGHWRDADADALRDSPHTETRWHARVLTPDEAEALAREAACENCDGNGFTRIFEDSDVAVAKACDWCGGAKTARAAVHVIAAALTDHRFCPAGHRRTLLSAGTTRCVTCDLLQDAAGALEVAARWIAAAATEDIDKAEAVDVAAELRRTSRKCTTALGVRGYTPGD